MAESVKDPVAARLSEDVLGTAQEWLRQMDVPDVTYGLGDVQKAVVWHTDGTVTIQDSRYGEAERRYRVTVLVEPADNWKPGTWGEVANLMAPPIAVAEVIVRLGGVEATVTYASLVQWNVDPKSNTYRPKPLAHENVTVRLAGRDQRYTFPPDGEVEILTPPIGEAVQALVERLGAEVIA